MKAYLKLRMIVGAVIMGCLFTANFSYAGWFGTEKPPAGLLSSNFIGADDTDYGITLQTFVDKGLSGEKSWEKSKDGQWILRSTVNDQASGKVVKFVLVFLQRPKQGKLIRFLLDGEEARLGTMIQFANNIAMPIVMSEDAGTDRSHKGANKKSGK